MAGKLRSLEETPTWAVAAVCFILVVISIFIEHLLHLLGKFFMKRNKRALYEAFEKVKSGNSEEKFLVISWLNVARNVSSLIAGYLLARQLMLLGFLSLLLTVGQNPISRICVSKSIGNGWHPCKNKYDMKNDDGLPPLGRKLLERDGANGSFRRSLASTEVDMCAQKGKVPIISTDAIHQLHIFIFVLAVFHVLYSIITLALGKLKMKKWKSWEGETRTVEYQFSHDPDRFRFARDTSFGRRHLNFWSKSPVLIWIVCFFRQFITSVSKVDYLTLRHGFVMAHLAPQSSMNFNFQKYIERSLERDFQVVVGISPLIWFFAVLFLLFNTQGWFSHFWLPFIPLIVILLVGTKLQVIITRMALQIMEHGDVVKGVPVVQPTDNLFWFNHPKLLLNLIHFVLFENAFQLAFFVFSWYKFGLKSCFHKEIEDILIRVIMGILTQILCSYVILPLYALVTQMGSNMKPVIFNERVATALKHWHNTARRHVKENRKSGAETPTTSRTNTPTASQQLSPIYLLRGYQNEVEIDVDSHNASPKHHRHDTDKVDVEDYTYTTEGSSSYNYRKSRMQGCGEGDLEMQKDSKSPPSVIPAISAEKVSKQMAINFSFDKRY